MPKNPSSQDEWRGARFIFISLLVTTASIIFFFAGRHIFSKIDTGAHSGWRQITGQLTEWGEMKLKSVELHVVNNHEIVNLPELASSDSPFDPIISRVQKRLDRFEGQSLWSLDLASIKDDILQEGWAKAVYIRRAFPDRLNVQILPRTAQFIMHASKQWVVIDDEGFVISVAKEIPGIWANRILVWGLEDVFSSGHSAPELNRGLKQVREAIKDLSMLTNAVSNRLGVAIESAHVAEDAWFGEYLFTLKWTQDDEKSTAVQKTIEATFLSHHWDDRLENLQYVLSDLHAKGLTNKNIKIRGEMPGKWIVAEGGKH